MPAPSLLDADQHLVLLSRASEVDWSQRQHENPTLGKVCPLNLEVYYQNGRFVHIPN